MKEEHRPFARYRRISFISCILLASTFILLLLVGLSLPIIKPIYLLIFRSTAASSQPLSIATELRFGVWGVCATSALNQPTPTSNPGTCFGPKLGYDVPAEIASLAGVSQQLIDTVETALLFVLVLHPISAGLAFSSFLSSLFLSSHAFSIFTLILTILTAIISSATLAVDLALVLVAQSKVEELDSFDFEIVFGNGVWMIVAAVVCVWLAVVTLSARACYCLGVRRYPREHHHHDSSDRY